MRDPRFDRLAEVLVNYSVELKPGQLVRIRGSLESVPLASACYRAALRAGAHPFVRLAPDDLAEFFYKHGSDDQLRFVSPLAELEIEKLDASIGFWGGCNTRALTGVDPVRQAMATSALRKIKQRFMARAAAGDLRWTGTMMPTNAAAQDAEMSLTEYEDFVFSAGLLEEPDPIAAWKDISARQEKIVRLLSEHKQFRLVAEETDLTFNMENRKWKNCDGHENFPDGEVFSGPVEDSVEGHIAYSFPCMYGGRESLGVRLTFREGKVVEATAEKGQDFLRAMIAQDDGACRVGEIAFGLNPNITRFTRNTLFDEKIGGTCHLALGSAYPETGNKNTSGLHWDMVCDLRESGQVFGDGKLIYEQGKFKEEK